MQRMLLVPLTILFQLKAVLEFFLVLEGMVIDPVADGALEADEIVLGHGRKLTINNSKCKIVHCKF